MFILIDNNTVEVVCCTETLMEAELIADVVCIGDFYVGTITDEFKAYTLRQLNKLIQSIATHAKEQVSRSFALKTFYEATLQVDVKTPADYGVTAGTQPLSPTLGENTMAATKKKAPAKKAAPKKAPAKKPAAKKASTAGTVWTRPTRGKTLELWELFDKLVKAKSATRKGMLDTAVEKGYNVATASTQYGRWLTDHIDQGGAAPERSVREKKAA